MAEGPNIAIFGAGLVGRRHAEVLRRHATLDAVIDPAEGTGDYAASLGVAHVADPERYLSRHRPDGVIIATPNQLHVAHGLACVEAGIPMLVEKPIADQAAPADKLVSAADAAGVPILVGYHRRHNPITDAAKDAIDAGRLGRIVAVTGQFWLYKPDDYFEQTWRQSAGAGPVFINLTHDIDLLRHLVGDITSVQARLSSAVRGFETEDTGAIILEFADGALGTFSVSDTTAAPWSWEFSAGENPAYPLVPGGAYRIGGTEASLSVPDLKLWHHPGAKSWWEPITHEVLPVTHGDSLEAQLLHFLDVTKGTAPKVSGAEGVKSLKVIEAIQEAARTGGTVRV